jgi:hypothetical protein
MSLRVIFVQNEAERADTAPPIPVDEARGTGVGVFLERLPTGHELGR